MNRRILLRAALLVLIVLPGCGGCNGCNQQGYVGEDTPRGRNLKQVFDERRDLNPPAPGQLPLRLEIDIDVDHQDKGNRYRPKLIWRRTASEGRTLQSLLRDQVIKQRPELSAGKGVALTLNLVYRDQEGQRCDVDRVTLNLDREQDTLILSTLGQSAAPVSTLAELVSVVWVEEEARVGFRTGLASSTLIDDKPSVPLKVPGNLPLRMEFIKGDIDPQNPARQAPRLQWFRVGNHDDLLALLRSSLSDKAPDLTGRAIKNCTMILVFKDAQGQALGTQSAVLELTRNEGTVPLPDLGKVKGPVTVVVEPTYTQWQQRRETIPLRN